MVLTVSKVLYALALVLFILAAVGVSFGMLALVPAGLACIAAGLLFA